MNQKILRINDLFYIFSAYFGYSMRESITFSTTKLLLTAIIFVSAAAIITGTILSTYTAIATSATKSAKTITTTTKEKNNDNKASSSKQPTIVTGPQIVPLTALSSSSPSTTTSTTITPDLPTTSTKSSTIMGTRVLSSVKALQTNNIVNTQSYYDIIFKTGTTATIGKIDVTFPSDTSLSSKVTVEVSGIGSGGYTSSGNTITYTVSSPVSISSGETIRLEFGGIGNPSTASSTLTVSVTTKASDGTVIEGPTTSPAYSIKQIGSADLSSSYTYRKEIDDTAAGNNIGWNPNGSETVFIVEDSGIDPSKSTVLINTKQTNHVVCSVEYLRPGFLNIGCNTPPLDGATLFYTVFQNPSTIIVK